MTQIQHFTYTLKILHPSNSVFNKSYFSIQPKHHGYCNPYNTKVVWIIHNKTRCSVIFYAKFATYVIHRWKMYNIDDSVGTEWKYRVEPQNNNLIIPVHRLTRQRTVLTLPVLVFTDSSLKRDEIGFMEDI